MDSIYKSNAEHLAELHKLRKEQSVEKVSKAIDRIIDENKPLTVSRVAQYANISSSTLYNNKDAMDIYNRKCQMYHYNKDVITVKEFIKNNPLCTNKELALNCNINEHKIRNILNTDPDIKPRHERIISNAALHLQLSENSLLLWLLPILACGTILSLCCCPRVSFPRSEFQ